MPQHHIRLAILLGALTALGPLGVDMYLPAFPAMGEGLRASPAEVQHTLATFLLGMAIGQVFYGPLADRVGRRLPMMLGLVLFTLASIGCALAQSAESLAWLRLLQALGGCVGTVVSRAVVRDLCDERGAVRMMSMLMLAMGAAPILAPMFGGWMLVGFGWRSIFWFLALYGAVALAVLAATLPESLAPEARRRDGPVAVLATYVSILRDRRFLAPALASSLPMAGLFAYLAGSPLVLMNVHGLTPSQYGLAFGSNALALIAASQVTARLVRLHAPGWLLPRVLVVQAVAGILALAAVLSGLLVPLLAALFLYLGLLGATLPLSGALAMQPMGRVAGSASALMGTIQFGLGAAIGALMGAIGGGALAMGVLIALAGAAGLSAFLALRPRLQ
jgi:DHA1 family bicyclomycin/chloramphenicol resistance-like MFS transporter